MKKRMILMLLGTALVFAVTSCGNEKSREENEKTAQESGQEGTEQAEGQQEETQQGGAEQGSTEQAEGQQEGAQQGSTEQEGTQQQDTQNQAEGAQTGSAGEGGSSNILVAYFTYAENAELPQGVDASSSASIQMWNGEVTGNTGAVAHMISDAVGGDLFSIQTVEKYPDNYDDAIDQGQEEQGENLRPELSTHIENPDSYDTVFLGFPNWWGDMPMAVYSFLDEYDLSGKTVIPFVTSGGSGFSGSISAIESAEPGASVQEGLALSASSAADAQDDVNEWLTELGYVK